MQRKCFKRTDLFKKLRNSGDRPVMELTSVLFSKNCNSLGGLKSRATDRTPPALLFIVAASIIWSVTVLERTTSRGVLSIDAYLTRRRAVGLLFATSKRFPRMWIMRSLDEPLLPITSSFTFAFLRRLSLLTRGIMYHRVNLRIPFRALCFFSCFEGSMLERVRAFRCERDWCDEWNY